MEFDNIIKPTCVPGSIAQINPETCLPFTKGEGGDDDGTGTGTGNGPADPRCVDPIFALAHPDICSVGPVTPPDDRCADSAFYDANPVICAGYPRLVIKPEYSITEAGKTVQYKTYVRTNGEETEVTAGLKYSANPAIAWISALDGLATAVANGITSVSVTWQNLTAYAQLEVVQSCSSLINVFALLIDHSASMSQQFSSSYASKLAFAKAMADGFIDSVNFSKDNVAVLAFGNAGMVVEPVTSDATEAKAAVNGIVSTSEKTNIDDALAAAITVLDGTNGTHIIVLFSDGENTGPDPLPRAKAFKESGGVILVVAERCWGVNFDLLYKISTAGFFLSAYEETQGTVQSTLQNLKSYICSGDCSPPEGTKFTAQLNYGAFINWDVKDTGDPGTINDPGSDVHAWPDLCGLGLYDVWPGNGLYVDMSGSFAQTLPAKLTSKVDFDLVAGHTYTFKIKIAGNNRLDPALPWCPPVIALPYANQTYPIKITIGSSTGTATPTEWTMPFTQYVFTFVPASSGAQKIVIEEVPNVGFTTVTAFGTWIDDVYFEDTTTATVLLFDDFNSENPVTIPPGGYGGNYGCLTTPPSAQTADPTPPPTLTE